MFVIIFQYFYYYLNRSKLITVFAINIQFHLQFFITYFGFSLVNILLRKFDTSSKKNETTKKCQESKCKYKVAFFTVNSPH